MQVFWAGVEDCVSVPALRERAVLLTNMQRVAGPVMAEHVVAMMLAFARGLQFFIPERAAGRWTDEPPSSVRMVTIEGKNVLVVGLGGIGTEVARRAHALGMRVTATRASGREGPEFVSYVGLPDELHKLAADADFIVNTTPLTPQTTGIFNAKFFAAAKPGAYFFNVGRGGSVVEADLVAALESGRIAGAGLDVTDPEPLPATSALWKMQNVIITPHVSVGLRPGARCPRRPHPREPAALRRRRAHAVGGRPRQGLLSAAGATQLLELAAQFRDRLLERLDPRFEAAFAGCAGGRCGGRGLRRCGRLRTGEELHVA